MIVENQKASKHTTDGIARETVSLELVSIDRSPVGAKQKGKDPRPRPFDLFVNLAELELLRKHDLKALRWLLLATKAECHILLVKLLYVCIMTTCDSDDHVVNEQFEAN